MITRIALHRLEAFSAVESLVFGMLVSHLGVSPDVSRQPAGDEPNVCTLTVSLGGRRVTRSFLASGPSCSPEYYRDHAWAILHSLRPDFFRAD